MIKHGCVSSEKAKAFHPTKMDTSSGKSIHHSHLLHKHSNTTYVDSSFLPTPLEKKKAFFRIHNGCKYIGTGIKRIIGRSIIGTAALHPEE